MVNSSSQHTGGVSHESRGGETGSARFMASSLLCVPHGDLNIVEPTTHTLDLNK